MPRSIREIYDAIIQEKEQLGSLAPLLPTPESSTTLLADLTSQSKVAIWRLLFWVVAVAQHVHEVFIDNLLANKEPGTLPWYINKCKEYQHGDPLVFVNGVYKYDPVIPANRIIDECNGAQSSNGIVVFKVAKRVGGQLAPLTAGELSGFEAYLNLVKFAGTLTATISDVADIFRVGYQVFYDPLILASNGELISTPGTFPVEDAINTYIQSLPFDGWLQLDKLTDDVQKATGVRNAILTQASYRYAALPYQNILVLPGQRYRPFAGYLEVSSTPGETLQDLVTYLPHS